MQSLVCAALPRPRVKWHVTHPYPSLSSRRQSSRASSDQCRWPSLRCSGAVTSPTKGFRCLPLPRRRGGQRSSSSRNRSVAGRQMASFAGHDDSGRGGACHRTLFLSCVWGCPRLGGENPEFRHSTHRFEGICGRTAGAASAWAKRPTATTTGIARPGTSPSDLSTSRGDEPVSLWVPRRSSSRLLLRPETLPTLSGVLGRPHLVDLGEQDFDVKSKSTARCRTWCTIERKTGWCSLKR